MDLRDEIWQKFMKTGDPGLFMLYKSLGGKTHEKDNNERN